MKKRPLTLLGLFLLILVACVTWSNLKESKTTQTKPQPQTSVVHQSKPSLAPMRTKKTERKVEEGFKVVTSVSMYDPSKTTSPEN